MMNTQSLNFKSSPKTCWHYNQGSLTRVKSSNLKENTVTYIQSTLLGSGISADVYLFTADTPGRGKAVKFSLNQISLKQEYELSLKWQNHSVGLLIRPKAYFATSLGDLFVMHCYDGPLREILETLSLNERIEAAFQISQGAVTLHELQICHGDIHLGNIFYDKKKNRFDLGDFGLSKTKETHNQFSFQNELEDLKEAIESILIGKEPDGFLRIMEGYKKRLNHWVDVLELGYEKESSNLIFALLNHPSPAAKDYLETFTKIKDLQNTP